MLQRGEAGEDPDIHSECDSTRLLHVTMILTQTMTYRFTGYTPYVALRIAA